MSRPTKNNPKGAHKDVTITGKQATHAESGKTFSEMYNVET